MLGIVGYSDWIEARLGFGERPAEAGEMLVPFCVVVLDLDRVLYEDRTTHYLIDYCNDHDGGRLADLPAWAAWAEQASALGEAGARTFQKRHDLHADRDRIATLLESYERLKADTLNRGLR